MASPAEKDITRDEALILAAEEAARAATSMVESLERFKEILKAVRSVSEGSRRAAMVAVMRDVERMRDMLEDSEKLYTKLPAEVAALKADFENAPNVSKALGRYRQALAGVVGSEPSLIHYLSMADQGVANATPDKGYGVDELVDAMTQAREELGRARAQLRALVAAAPKVTKNLDVQVGLLGHLGAVIRQ